MNSVITRLFFTCMSEVSYTATITSSSMRVQRGSPYHNLFFYFKRHPILYKALTRREATILASIRTRRSLSNKWLLDSGLAESPNRPFYGACETTHILCSCVSTTKRQGRAAASTPSVSTRLERRCGGF